MAEKRDYYEVLGVSKSATDAEIKKAYHAMVKKYHPDLHPDDKEAEEKMKEVNEAYDVLSDKDKRAKYDRAGFAGVDPSYGAGSGAGAGGFGGFGGMGGFGDIGDIFGDIFSGFGGFGGMGGFGQSRQNPNAPRRGQDIRTDVQISFMDACKGVDVTVRVNRNEKCPQCHGSGAKPGTSPETCPDCRGTGSVRTAQRFGGAVIQSTSVCPRCRGTGRIIRELCPGCSGQGVVRRPFTKTVSIPRGVDNGNTDRITGEGDCGINGGENGDIIIRINVKPDEMFEREGSDIYSEVPISYLQAALGDEITVPTIDGGEKFRIPPGTQNGTVFVLRNKGVYKLYRPTRGDHHFAVRVDVPKNLNRRQAELLKAFDDSLEERNKSDRKNIFDRMTGKFGK